MCFYHGWRNKQWHRTKKSPTHSTVINQLYESFKSLWKMPILKKTMQEFRHCVCTKIKSAFNSVLSRTLWSTLVHITHFNSPTRGDDTVFCQHPNTLRYIPHERHQERQQPKCWGAVRNPGDDSGVQGLRETFRKKKRSYNLNVSSFSWEHWTLQLKQEALNTAPPRDTMRTLTSAGVRRALLPSAGPWPASSVTQHARVLYP